MIEYIGQNMLVNGELLPRADDYPGIEDRDDNVRPLFPRIPPTEINSASALQESVTANDKLVRPDLYDEETQRSTGRGVLFIVGKQPDQPVTTDNVTHLPARIHKIPLAHDDFPEDGVERERDAHERQFKD